VRFFNTVDEGGVLDYALVFLGIYEAIGYEGAFAVRARDHAGAGVGFGGGSGFGAHGGALFGGCGGLHMVLLALQQNARRVRGWYHYCRCQHRFEECA
jgi:hypothetical protein